MTISNGSVITKADLDGSFSVSTFVTRKAAALKYAGCYLLTFDWDTVTSGTASDLLTQKVTIGDDDQEVLAFGGYVDGTSGDYTLTLTGPSVASMSVSISSSTGDLSRYNSGGDKPLQVLLRGATYTMTPTIGPGSGTNRLRGFLLLRTRPRKR